MKNYLQLKQQLQESTKPVNRANIIFFEMIIPTKQHSSIILESMSLPGETFIGILPQSKSNPIITESKIEYLDSLVPCADRVFVVESQEELIQAVTANGFDQITLFSESKANVYQWIHIDVDVTLEEAKAADIPANLKEQLTIKDPIREAYKAGDIFNIGAFVYSSSLDEFYQIVDRGSNYVRVVNESGKIKSVWLDTVVEVSVSDELVEKFAARNAKQNQFYYKGFATNSFSKEITEAFEKTIDTDPYAMLQAVKCTDKFFASQSIVEQYELFEKSGKYLASLQTGSHAYRDQMETIVAEKMLEDIPAISKITKNDKVKTAKIIAAAFGLDDKGSPEEIINGCAKAIAQDMPSEELQDTYGQLFQLADDVGIVWDKTLFTPSQLRKLSLSEAALIDKLDAIVEHITNSISFEDILPLYHNKDIIAVNESGKQFALGSAPILEAAAAAIRTSTKEQPRTLAVKEVDTRKAEQKAKSLVLKYLRDRALRTTLGKMSDRERTRLEDILAGKGSVISASTKKLVDKIVAIEKERQAK